MSTDVANETHPLTADELKALRKATGISFHYRDGKAFVGATIEHDPGDGFGRREIRREIPAQFKATIYERDLSSGRTEPTSCFWSLISARVTPEWATLKSMLRTDDELILHWTGANNSEAVREAGFMVDEFRVEVRRWNKERTKLQAHMVFLLGVSVTNRNGIRDIHFR